MAGPFASARKSPPLNRPVFSAGSSRIAPASKISIGSLQSVGAESAIAGTRPSGAILRKSAGVVCSADVSSVDHEIESDLFEKYRDLVTIGRGPKNRSIISVDCVV
jgi:hypothetical protein